MGYVGYSRSNNSAYAINECIVPKTHINKKLINDVIECVQSDDFEWWERISKWNWYFINQVGEFVGNDEIDGGGDDEEELLNGYKEKFIEFIKTVKIKDIKNNLDIDDSDEWHHTSKFYNEVTHYDVISILLGMFFKNEMSK